MPQPKPKGPNCFGCLIFCLVSTVLLCVAGYYGVKYLVHSSLEMIAEDYPMNVETVPSSATEREQIEQQIKQFVEEVKSGTVREPLRLSGEQITIALEKHNFWPGMKYRIYFENNKIRTAFSTPLEQSPIGIFQMDGKYLNGNLVFQLQKSGQNLKVLVSSFKSSSGDVFDFENPSASTGGDPTVLAEFKETISSTVSDLVNNDPEAKHMISKLKDIRVENGYLVVEP